MRPSSIFLNLSSFGSVRGSRGIWVCSTQIVSLSMQLAYVGATKSTESYIGPHRHIASLHCTVLHRSTASSYRIVVPHVAPHVVLHRSTPSSYCIVVPHRRTASPYRTSHRTSHCTSHCTSYCIVAPHCRTALSHRIVAPCRRTASRAAYYNL